MPPPITRGYCGQATRFLSRAPKSKTHQPGSSFSATSRNGPCLDLDNDLSTDTNPFEAGFGRFAYFDGPGYVAADSLRRISESKSERKLVGFKMTGRGIPRAWLKVLSASNNPEVIGTVTSGTHSPTVDGGIGIGYVEQKYAETGSEIVIDVRGRLVEAKIVDMPFYKRG
ncbi:MAG TPA: hypothetical protein EYM69_04220 [Dehalococcoidia bacterium]|nr:hypothetical protein [Dehalococcoidia bacterium]